MPIIPTSFNNIKVGYVSQTEGYIKNVSLTDANTYAQSFPDTQFIFIDGDGNVQYLNIDQVNALTPKSLLRSDPCDTSDKKCGPPKLKFFGGRGVGAQANPIVDVNGNLIAVDLVNGGFGYKSPPQVQVIDPCQNGSGAVLKTIIKDGIVVKVIIGDSGNGYLPPPPESTNQYPAVLTLTDVVVKDPGIGYNCGVDMLTITPSNGTVLSYKCDPFGKIRSVSVDKGGRFTELPQIMMDTETGFNAKFTPFFDVIRDPQPIEAEATDVVQVYDLVGLNVQGWVDGKVYYGNTFYVNGVKYAGTNSNSSNYVRVYNTRSGSIANAESLVGYVNGQPYYGSYHAMSDGRLMTGAIHSPASQLISQATTATGFSVAEGLPTSESTSSTDTPSAPTSVSPTLTAPEPTPAPAPAPTPTPSPSPPPSSGDSGGGGGYSGGY